MSDRFRVCEYEEIREAENFAEYDYWDADIRSFLLDTWTNTVVFADGGEPEDQTLGRDLYGLVVLLNRAYPE